MGSLLEQLLVYSNEDYYPMHMPGHKRNTELLKGFHPYNIDITEIDGFDNLHHSEGVIKELIEQIQHIYHSNKSYLLINGSTVGILAGISACTQKKDRIVMARNCHKSVYNAVILNELDPIYIYPQEDGIYGIHGGISPEKIKELLITYPDIKLVVLTSPTYEGIISDIKSIVEICHQYKVPVIVDEAHGAHLGLYDELPSNSIQAGADIVIHSIHKTLPAFTQTAVMHVNSDLVNYEEVEKYLAIYETSSPSYILMAGVDQCMNLIQEQGTELFQDYVNRLSVFYDKVSKLKKLKVMRWSDYTDRQRKEGNMYAIDPSKIVISVKNTDISGNELSQILLKEYKIQLEMSSMNYALAMTSICDTEKGFSRLAKSLCEIEKTLSDSNGEQMSMSGCGIQVTRAINKKGLIPYDAIHSKCETIQLKNAGERVAANHIMIYPPGIPLVAAGEIICEAHIKELIQARESGLEILGLVEQNGTEAEQNATKVREDIDNEELRVKVVLS